MRIRGGCSGGPGKRETLGRVEEKWGQLAGIATRRSMFEQRSWQKTPESCALLEGFNPRLLHADTAVSDRYCLICSQIVTVAIQLLCYPIPSFNFCSRRPNRLRHSQGGKCS